MAVPEVVLVDLHGSLTVAAEAVGWAEKIIMAPWTNMTDVLRTHHTMPPVHMKRIAFVSPANSLGFMDGGIDYVYSRMMFPGVEGEVKMAIAGRRKMTRLGRPYLDIGDALTVPVPVPELTVLNICPQYTGEVFLIVAPTMWLPQDVRGTRNAYRAMYAALRAATEAGIERIYVPGMCTGCGMMPAGDAVTQMAAAHADFMAGVSVTEKDESIIDDQPCVYENTEFKEIRPEDVVHRR